MTERLVDRRYPYEPLERVVASRNNLDITVGRWGPKFEAGHLAADMFGVSHRTILRWSKVGLTRFTATEAAEAVREHPYVLWPEMRDDDIADITVTCEADDCDKTFIVSPYGRGGKGKRFCGETCRARMKNRRLRVNPKRRELDRLRQRRYEAEVRAARLAREQRRAARAAA